MNATSARSDVRATRLTGCVVLVTGGARGQGASHAHRLASEGATVWACDVLDAEGAALVGRLEAEGLDVRYRHLDVTSPDVVTMRRIVIAQAERFPALARTWYASGPARAHEVLTEQLTQLHRRGLLHVPEPALAAQQLNWLIISIPLNEATFSSEPIAFDDALLRRYADSAVDVFLAAYRPVDR